MLHALQRMRVDLLETRRAASAGAERILHRICARAFAYRLDPGEEGWTLLVECATDGGWRGCVLPVDPGELIRSLRDAGLEDRLAGRWTTELRFA